MNRDEMIGNIKNEIWDFIIIGGGATGVGSGAGSGTFLDKLIC